MRGVALAGCLTLVGPAVLSYADMLAIPPVGDPRVSPNGAPGQQLGVVVPVYRGDLSRAVSSLDRWPSTCSPLTEKNADLILYYAEGEEDAPAVTAAVETINETAGRCFGKTRLVYAHLSEEEDVYPKGPSVMFFKMFLDEGVRSELSEYDALAIVEWDVLVASDSSFEELHYAAFRGNEDFWVKGSNLGGTTYHSTAQEPGMWNMLGHINGNAIYNNNDPEFVAYVDYTRTRWDYTYPYDVALWLTISDFPYSWPLWQRYSSNFVTTNLISYVGSEHVDNTTVSDAIAGQTLFIHGSRVDAGNLASLRATKHERMPVYDSGPRLSDDNENLLATCNTACGSDDKADLPVGTSTVCDDTCAGESARFGGLFCGAGDSDKFGDTCRLCYVDIEVARREEQSLGLTRSDPEGEQEASHVIMCDTMRPPEAVECSDKCGRKKDTVCDESCGTGRHGDYNCNWRDYGEKCRFCFDDLETALMADNVAQRRGGRVIMCSTLEPPQPKEQLEPDDLLMKSQPRWRPPRQLQKWNKWRNNYCDEEDCPYTSKDGTRGRVCDETCKDGDPYGTLGCRAKKGKYGNYCRACYNDRDKAIENDTAENRAMMCGDGSPVPSGAYIMGFLAAPMEESASHIGQMLKAWKDSSTINKDVDNNSLDKRKQRKQRKLQDWRAAAKWQAANRWKGNADHDVLPTWQHSDKNNDGTLKWPTEEQLLEKWQANEKWKNYCDEEDCPYTSKDGTRGRVCDDSCKDGNPYGTNGCRARKGKYGNYCRVCYNDRDKAIDNDDPDGRAIMCAPATVSPDMEYSSSSRRLAESVKKRAPRMLPPMSAKGKDAQSMFADATVLPYVNDLVRGNLCTFVAGHLNEVDQVEVAVMSVLQFLPGMTVAVAADHEGFDAYERAVGGLPGVTVHGTEDPSTASLFADNFCGVDTSLIFYMQPGSVVSRQFTSKDTHSTHGDLLVVHGNAKLSYVDRDLARQTTAVLGFEAPSFTFNTDLFLPVGANADLRDTLVSGLDIDRQPDGHGRALEVMEGLMKPGDTSAVPQLMAALAYSRNTPGVWFVDPETWVSQHLFETASIWEIPLVKPRFSCSIERSSMLSDAADIDMGLILQSNLDFFTNGGTCESGSIDMHLGD